MNDNGTQIREIAQQLGVPVKDVLVRLREHGVKARSGSSTLTRQVERWLRDSYRPLSQRKPDLLASAEGPEDVVIRTQSSNPARPQPGKKARKRPIRPRRSGIPFISKEEQIAEWEARKPPLDPEKVRKRIHELNTPERRRPKTEIEKASDDAASEAMRSHKPSSWRRGRSPGSYS
ncbi:hypothetical protein ACWDUN_00675 [Mycobacterium sp. NPDC003323]